MPNARDLPSNNGKGPTQRGSASPLRPGSTNAGLGDPRGGGGVARSRTNSQQRLDAIRQATANKPK